MAALNRRQFLKTVAGVTAGITLAGCQGERWISHYPALTDWPAAGADPTWRLLNRITFGPRPEERRRLARIGPAAFIEEQLAPESLPGPDMALGPRLNVRRLETLPLDVADLFDVARQVVTQELQQATLLRAVYSRRQLYEIMVSFWSDHFNIAQTKGDCAWLKTVDDRAVIRPHALGNFRDLLQASAHSPAMLVYLDNQENVAGNPNENYARELMELHTLGVDGGYIQQDVQELARCLTGWTVKDHFYRGQFTFNGDLHDDEAKRILDLSVPAGLGRRGGEQVIDMLAEHPATAHFIAAKLARRFVADIPPPGLVARTAQTFLKTRGDIKATLRVILLSPEMLTPEQPTSAKLKRPFEFVVSALRQLSAGTDGGPVVQQYLADMGQPLFQWPMPDGFPIRAEAWQGSLLHRWRFALALAHGNLPGTSLDLSALMGITAGSSAERLRQVAFLLLGQPLPAATTDQLLQNGYDDRVLLASLLGSPMFQWK